MTGVPAVVYNDDDNDHDDEVSMARSLTTGEVAETLGVSEPKLQDLIRRWKIPRPEKYRGRRVWTPKDVAAARMALANGAK